MDFLVIDDDKVFRDATCLLIEDEGHYALTAGTAEVALTLLREEKFDGALLDLNLGRDNGLAVLPQILKIRPNLPVVMFSAQSTVKKAVEAIHLGAVDFLEKPFTRAQFHAVIARIQKFSQMEMQIERLEQEVKESKAENPEPLFDFETPSMRSVIEVLSRSAKTAASVLILGESGTGKSVAARALHENSHLNDRPLVTVSCPSLSKELLESTLFGHVRGAFTGALKDHWGKVKAASGGTLFLDEIGDLPLEIQPKLLRLLQEREYERVGETITRQADVRIVAATNRDLKKRVAEGSFREDLYYRLNVISVKIPPLRERPGDLLRFANHYLRHFARQVERPVEHFTAEAEAAVRLYSWPGNLRELRNAIERAVILCTGSEVGLADLPAELRAEGAIPDGAAEAAAVGAGGMISIERLEEIHIRRILERTPSMVQAADILGIDQATLYRKRKKLGLD
ncbi:MAG TPA: sigma-54 dependent transcriptional regulator [Candidatus Didemnitutus sp.]|jgi:NtrC-family two-component system response regulator AlgB